ncbi:MAG: hypothetical protein U0835_06930 [Isosphaeraceae bacterium]
MAVGVILGALEAPWVRVVERFVGMWGPGWERTYRRTGWEILGRQVNPSWPPAPGGLAAPAAVATACTAVARGTFRLPRRPVLMASWLFLAVAGYERYHLWVLDDVRYLSGYWLALGALAVLAVTETCDTGEERSVSASRFARVRD